MNEAYEYRQELNALHFTPEQKAAIAARTALAAEQPVRHRPVFRTALIAAALAAALLVGAGATGALEPVADILAPIFGGTSAQTEVIDKIGHPIGASATADGVTITADAIIGDKYNACIVYSVSRDDGTPLLPEGVKPEQLMLGGFGGASWGRGGVSGCAYFTDNDPTDNKIQYVEAVSSDTPISRGRAKAEFEDLYYSDSSGEQQLLAKGRWRFRFDVDYEDTAVTLGGGETFAQDGLNFTVDEVTVSPVAVRVAYTVDSEVQWSNAPSGREDEEDSRQMDRYLGDVAILLTKTDGTVLNLSGAGGSVSPKDGTTVCTKSCVLDELVPVEEIASVSIGGVVYPVSRNG